MSSSVMSCVWMLFPGKSFPTSISVRIKAALLSTGLLMDSRLESMSETWPYIMNFRVFNRLLFFWGGGVPEAHQGASWGGERATLPSSRLQQGFYDRSLPAAAREAHPHRWGPKKGLWHLCKYKYDFKIAICALPEERNYICDQCGQTFKQRKHLSVHQMRHSGAKPLQ